MRKIVPVFTLLVAVFVLAGCSTVDSRVREKQSAFNSLTPVEQADIKQGLADAGYTTEMVYMAMDNGDRAQNNTKVTSTANSWAHVLIELIANILDSCI